MFYVVEVKGYGDEWLPILRMYRGVFLLVMIIFLVAINTCGWRAVGVNHVLIFELNPRTHLTYQQVLEVGFVKLSPVINRAELQGPVVRRVHSAIHRIAIFPNFVHLLV